MNCNCMDIKQQRSFMGDNIQLTAGERLSRHFKFISQYHRSKHVPNTTSM